MEIIIAALISAALTFGFMSEKAPECKPEQVQQDKK